MHTWLPFTVRGKTNSFTIPMEVRREGTFGSEGKGREIPSLGLMELPGIIRTGLRTIRVTDMRSAQKFLL